MTTTSLKHIVSNVENIRNPVITHCYYWVPDVFWSLFSLCFCFPLFYVLLFLFLSFATGVCFSFLQPISRSPFFTNSLILVALRFAYRLLDPHLYLLSICLANNSLGSVQWYADAFPHPVFSLRSFLYPHFSVISSSWYAALDT